LTKTWRAVATIRGGCFLTQQCGDTGGNGLVPGTVNFNRHCWWANCAHAVSLAIPETTKAVLKDWLEVQGVEPGPFSSVLTAPPKGNGLRA